MESSSNNNLDSDISIRDDELHDVSLVVPSSSSLPLALSLSHNTATTTTFAPPTSPQQQQQQQQQQQRRHVDANSNDDEHDHHHQDNTGANANANADNLYLCKKCNLMLGRHRFPKKILKKITRSRRISSDVEEQNVNSNNITTKTIKTTIATTDDDTSLVLVCHQCRKINGAIRMKQPKPKYTNFITDSGKSNSGLTRRPNNWGYCNYLDKLFSMNCYTDIVQLKVFQSAKDISESMAAIYAIFHHSTHAVDVNGIREKGKEGYDEQDNRKGNKKRDNNRKDEKKKVLCLCIGDGCTPRTAVLLSFLTKGLWDCVSIDPALSNEWSGDHLDDSNNISSKSEDDTSDSEQTQKQKQKQKQKQVVRGLYGYKGTLKEFVLDSNRPPFNNKRTCTASNNKGHHNNSNSNSNSNSNNNNNNNNAEDDDGGDESENENKNDYYQHLILLCVHSHARFIDESTVDNIRSLYTTDPNPSSSSSSLSSSSRATLPYCNDINNTPNLSPNNNPPPFTTSLLIPTTIVSLPCCPQYRHVRDIGIQPHIKYDDDCVFSACRSVEVWNL